MDRVIDPGSMRHAMAGFATGLAVVAAQIDGQIVGMPVNSLGSVSLDPPLVSLAFAHTSTTWPRLRDVPRWGISVLGAGMEPELKDLRRPAAQRFDGIDTEVTDGAVFVHGALARLEVAQRSVHEVGDHALVQLDVLALARDEAQEPRVFFGSRVRTLAP